MQHPPNLIKRTHEFGSQALRFYEALPNTKQAQHAGFQFYRAATSVEFNYRAAKRGRSRDEFISKLGTVVEEIDEAVGWLEHMKEGNIADDERLLDEARQLQKILAKSLGTARRNAARKRADDQQLKRSKFKNS